MADIATIVATLTLGGPMVREVFKLLVQDKSIRFGDLVKKASGERHEVKQALETLKDASLVKEAGAAIEDFSTYYVTADGLEAGRKVGV